MDCEVTRELIHAYVDRELDLVKSLEIERHLAACHSCSGIYASLRALQRGIGSLYHKPASNFERRVKSTIHKVSRKEAKPHALPLRWIAVATSVAVVLIAGWVAIRLLSFSSGGELVAQEVVASHVRSLMVNHLTDVESSDRHTVKPWFNGKLDFSPPVIDLTENGFDLVGGRLDYLDNRSVSALVYQRRKHWINLFIWPSTRGERPEQVTTIQGYNAIHWSQSGMHYWAVSDLNPGELKEFVRLVRNESTQTAP